MSSCHSRDSPVSRETLKGVFFMRRKEPQAKDRKEFRRTAVKAKRININPTIYRGGIRL